VTGTKRLVRMAIQHALESGRKSVTWCTREHPEIYRRRVPQWGYDVATEEFRDKVVPNAKSWIVDNKDKNPSLTVAQKRRR